MQPMSTSSPSIHEKNSNNWDSFLKDKKELRKSVFHEKALKMKQHSYKSNLTENDEEGSDEDSIEIKSDPADGEQEVRQMVKS